MKVKIVRRKKGVSLVEWVETMDGAPRYHRSILPLSELTNVRGAEAEHDDPHVGIPYGLPWESLLDDGNVPAPMIDALANELRRLGIWTYADLQRDPQSANAAFQKIYGIQVQRLREAARNFTIRR